MYNTGLINNRRYLESVLRKIGNEEPVDLYMKSDRITTLASLYLLVYKYPRIRFLQLDIDIKKMTPDLIYAARSAHGFFIRFHTFSLISKAKWRMIQKLKGTIYIDDFSGGMNTQKYQTNKRILYNDTHNQSLKKYNLYSTVAGRTGMECEFSSCLGKNIYISKDGNMSFCPIYPERSLLGSVLSERKPFENEYFAECLKSMIRKRENCKRICKWFYLCNGGCVFKSDCQQQKENLSRAFSDIEETIKRRKSLENLPFYLEQSVLYKLFVSRKH